MMYRPQIVLSVLLCGMFIASVSAQDIDSSRRSAKERLYRPVRERSASKQKSFEHKDYLTGQAVETLLNIFRVVDLYYVDSVGPGELVRNAADGMLGELDPYTVYMPADEMDEFKTLTTGKYAGIGALIRQREGWVEIAEPYIGSPADRAGVKAGDRIISIAGKSMQRATVTDVSSNLKGTPGSKVEIVLSPVDDSLARRTVEIARERIRVPSIPYFGRVADSIGYIRLDSFTENCAAELRRALQDLTDGGHLSGLVLDLRNNSGGILGEAVRIMSMFVPRGTTVVTTRGKVKQMNTNYTTKTDPIAASLPLAVLIGNGSASASEIIAGGLQDLDRAVIIGQRSFGKGLVQSTHHVADNDFVKLTTAKYYTPSGRCIQAVDYAHRNDDGSVGVIPDSLIGEFRTAASRRVYDGGGIMPDVKTPPSHVSKFTAILYSLGYIDDFANIYAAGHRDITTNVAIDGRDTLIYREFVKFMEDKPIDFQSGTQSKLAELRKVAEREKYADRITAELDAIATKIQEDKMTDLSTFADEIRQMLIRQINTRLHYASGAIMYSLPGDGDVAEAVKVLNNKPLYNTIITSRDTVRN